MKPDSRRPLRAERLETRNLLAAASTHLVERVASLPTDSVAYIAGDANRDGSFDELDILSVLQAGKYLSGETADWSEGDWNGDHVFDSDDLVMALQSGRYAGGEAVSATQASSVEVKRFSDQGIVPGASYELIRRPESIKIVFETSELTPGHIYSLSVVVFNDPSQCTDGICGGDDIGGAGTLVVGTGNLVNSESHTFVANIGVGQGVLTNPAGGEFHAILEDKGPKLPGDIHDQLHVDGGGQWVQFGVQRP